MNVLKSREHMDEHPIDRHYLGLNCKLDYIDPEDGVFKMVEKYVRQTHGWTHKQYQLQVSSLLERPLSFRTTTQTYADILAMILFMVFAYCIAGLLPPAKFRFLSFSDPK